MATSGVLLDACVLYPARLRDTLLSAAELALFRPRWTDAILDETRRNLIEDGRMSEEQADRLLHQLRVAFPDADVPGYRPLIAAMTNQSKDRHVAAAAVAGQAQVIVTFNLRDFPRASLEGFGVEARSPDAFLGDLAARSPRQMVRVIENQAKWLNKPPMVVEEILDALAKHAPTFVSTIRALRRTAPSDSAAAHGIGENGAP